MTIKARKLHVLRTNSGDIRVSWDDIENTGKLEDGRKLFRLKGTDTEGFKIHRCELDEEQYQRSAALVEWLSSSGVPPEHKSGLEAMIEAFK